jgi:hypothetical protein
MLDIINEPIVRAVASSLSLMHERPQDDSTIAMHCNQNAATV